MQRPSDFRMGHGGFLTPYRYGDKKWEGYLLDTQAHIYDGARAQVEAVESIGRQAAEQHSEQLALLQDFISNSEGAWDRVSSQLDTLTDQMITGFSTLSYQLKYNAELLEDIVDRLDRIAESINNPLATQANELVRSGEHLLRRGLYREAFGDFTTAEGKRAVNPILQLHLAQLHYHVLDEGVPFDFSAAELHVNLAIRYATSLRDDLGTNGAAVIDLVYRTAAHLALVKGGDRCKSDGPEAGTAELRRSDGCIRQIDQPSPSSQFLHAQVLALLERPDEAIAMLKGLVDYTRSWIPRALLEPNLAGIAERVRALSEDLRSAPGVHSQKVYLLIVIGRDWATQCLSIANEFSAPAADLTVQINEIEHDFEVGVINAAYAATALEAAHESAKGKTLALMLASVDELEENRKREVQDAEHHAWRAKRTWKLGGFLWECVGAFDTDENFGLMLGGCVLGWILGAMSCKEAVHGGWKQFAYFVIAGPITAVVLSLFRKIIRYDRSVNSRSEAATEKVLGMRAREQAALLEQRIKDVKGMRDALK